MDLNSPLTSMSEKELRKLARRIKKELSRRRYLVGAGELVPQNTVGGRRRRFTLYVLLCKNQKYYVGITAQKVESRFEQHRSGKGAKWTKANQPIGILESYPIGFMSESDAAVIENQKTHQLIAEHGADNVRGGDLCVMNQKSMDKQIEKSMQRLLKIKKKADESRAVDSDKIQEDIARQISELNI